VARLRGDGRNALSRSEKATGAAGIGKPKSAVPEEYRTQPMSLAEVGISKKLSYVCVNKKRLSYE
jgi:hypothetical protein